MTDKERKKTEHFDGEKSGLDGLAFTSHTGSKRRGMNKSAELSESWIQIWEINGRVKPGFWCDDFCPVLLKTHTFQNKNPRNTVCQEFAAISQKLETWTINKPIFNCFAVHDEM